MNKLDRIMDICNNWTQYHKDLRRELGKEAYDKITNTVINPIMTVILEAS